MVGFWSGGGLAFFTQPGLGDDVPVQFAPVPARAGFMADIVLWGKLAAVLLLAGDSRIRQPCDQARMDWPRTDAGLGGVSRCE